jgi:hypothetical protein
MKLDLFTARRILRAVLAGMPAETALWIVEQALDGYDMIEALEQVMWKAIEGDQEEVKILCQRLRGDVDDLETCEAPHHG